MSKNKKKFPTYSLKKEPEIPPSFNEGQRKAFEVLLDFILNRGDMKDVNYIGLSGGPGYGKTFVLGNLYNLLPDQVKTKIHFTATTNKAAQELQKAVNEFSATDHDFVHDDDEEDAKGNRRVSTVFKKLNLILVGVKKKLAKKAADPNMSVHDVLIIDEASFINEELLAYILEETRNRIKVIFVGDKNQLCPIGLDYTPIYTECLTNMANLDEPMTILELTQVMRQTTPNSYIVRYTNEIKKFIEGETKELPKIEPQLEIEHVNAKTFEKLILQTYNEDKTFKILAQTNAKVAKYNGLVNKHLRDDRYLRAGDTATVNTRTSTYFTDESVMVVESEEVEDISVTCSYKYNGELVEKEWPGLKGRMLRVTNGVDICDYFVPYQQGKTREIVQTDIGLNSGVADLRPVFACTIHKSQGGTFDVVFLDLSSFSSQIQGTELARLIYVAVSRAKSKVYITGSHPEIYDV